MGHVAAAGGGGVYEHGHGFLALGGLGRTGGSVTGGRVGRSTGGLIGGTVTGGRVTGGKGTGGLTMGGRLMGLGCLGFLCFGCGLPHVPQPRMGVAVEMKSMQMMRRAESLEESIFFFFSLF